MPSTAPFRDRQRHYWNSVAGGSAAWLTWTERNFSSVTGWLRGAAGWTPGARVLDVACGAGYPALAAAACVCPGGTVVATDLSPGMIAAAARGAKAARLENVAFVEMDAEDLRFENAWFAAVTNAYGLMFCPDPQRAIDEMHRVLEPGCRAALAVWDDPAKNPFFTLIADVAARFFPLPPADPAAPGPFRLAAAGKLESLLGASGFSHVHVESHSMTVQCESVAEYCQIFADIAWKSRIASLTDSEAALFREAIAEAAEPYVDGGRLSLLATSLSASARK